jgi:DNA-binding GntR family transcriptional regulator
MGPARRRRSRPAVTRKLGVSEKRALRQHIEKERRADEERNHSDMISLSGDFHVLLCNFAENAILSKFLGELITRESLVIQAYERPGGRAVHSRA